MGTLLLHSLGKKASSWPAVLLESGPYHCRRHQMQEVDLGFNTELQTHMKDKCQRLIMNTLLEVFFKT